jgi:hypothetical protein
LNETPRSTTWASVGGGACCLLTHRDTALTIRKLRPSATPIDLCSRDATADRVRVRSVSADYPPVAPGGAPAGEASSRRSPPTSQAWRSEWSVRADSGSPASSAGKAWTNAVTRGGVSGSLRHTGRGTRRSQRVGCLQPPQDQRIRRITRASARNPPDPAIMPRPITTLNAVRRSAAGAAPVHPRPSHRTHRCHAAVLDNLHDVLAAGRGSARAHRASSRGHRSTRHPDPLTARLHPGQLKDLMSWHLTPGRAPHCQVR